MNHQAKKIYIVLWSGGYDPPGVFVSSNLSKVYQTHATWDEDANEDDGEMVQLFRFDTVTGVLTEI